MRLVMASAQQKPKRDKGTRNSKRRNGKAPKQDVAIIQEPIYAVTPAVEDENGTVSEWKMLLERVDTYKTPRYGKNGNRLTGKGRPRGKSYLGVSLKRLQAQADAREVSLGHVKDELRRKREQRDATRRQMPRAAIALQVREQREEKLRASLAIKAKNTQLGTRSGKTETKKAAA